MPDVPRQIRLAAGDYYMHGQDHKLRRAGLPGYVCRVALRLEDGLDVEPSAPARGNFAGSGLAGARAPQSSAAGLPPALAHVVAVRPIFFEHNHQNGNGPGLGCCRRRFSNATCTPTGVRDWRLTWCGTPTGPGTWSFLEPCVDGCARRGIDLAASERRQRWETERPPSRT
jgi:hypothetical protein